MGCLGGVGFTVALFLTEAALPSASLRDEAKVGILAAAVLSSLAAAVVLAVRRPPSARQEARAFQPP